MKLWVISRKTCVIALSALLVVVLSVFVVKNAAISASAKQKDLPIYCVDKGDEKIASISFDAACPNCNVAKNLAYRFF